MAVLMKSVSIFFSDFPFHKFLSLIRSIHSSGILEEKTVKKPYVVQCYHLIREARAEGLSMVDIQQKLGVTKLFARLLLKLLQKYEFIVNVSSDDARKRFFKSVNWLIFEFYRKNTNFRNYRLG